MPTVAPRSETVSAPPRSDADAGFRAVFDAALTPMALVGLDGRYTDVNPAFCRLVGRDADRLIGCTPASITHPDDLARDRALIDQLLRGEISTHRVEKRYVHDNGSVVWVAVNTSVQIDAAGQPLRMLAQIEPLAADIGASPEVATTHEHLSTLASSLPIGIFRAAIDGRVIETNTRWREIFDIGPGPFTGWEWIDALHPDDAATVLDDVADSVGNQLQFAATFRVRWRSGVHRWIRAAANPVRSLDGSPAGFVGSVEDITDRVDADERLREVTQQFHQAFDNAPIGMALVALDGTWMAVNQSLVQLLGYTADDLLASTFQDITHPDDLDEDLELAGQLLDGRIETYALDKRYLTASGEIVWVNLSVSTVDDAEGRPRYFVSQIVDITERKATERQLLSSAQRLARSNSELVEFASVAAHDLAQPLRVIDGYLHLLSSHCADRLDDDGHLFIEQAIAGAARLQVFIDDLLTYARSTDTRVIHRRVALDEVVAEALASLAVQIRETDAVVRVAELPAVHGHARQLGQVVQNLVGNALRFARPGESPVVTISAERDDDAWVVTVADRGVGIPADRREQVFGMFQRLDTAGGGTGIGLAICRKVAESHGGRIWIDDHHGGAAVRLLLPDH